MSEQQSTFALSDAELASPAIVKLMEHYAARLERLRVQNDTNHPKEKTAHLRGRIAECKAFLALASPAPGPVANDE